MVGGDEVGVGAGRLLSGQGQHLRTQRGDHRGRVLTGRHARVGSGGHLVQITAHGRHGRTVVQASHALDEGLVRNADAEQEPAAGLLGQRFLSRDGDAWLPVVDVGDPGGYDQLVGVGQQPGSVDHGVTSRRFGYPERAVTQPFNALRGFCRGASGQAIEEVPDAKLAHIHDQRP